MKSFRDKAVPTRLKGLREAELDRDLLGRCLQTNIV